MNISRKKIVKQNDDACKNTFSVLTYNILADCHVVPCRNENYHFVDDEHLFKNEGINSKRHLLTMKEIEYFNADIVLLQEVEEWYSPLIASELERVGYDYTFYQKIGIPEGSALCYKKDKFQCVDTRKIFIHDEVIKVCNIEGVSEVSTNQMAEPNVSLITTLKDMKSGKIIICATVHMIYDEFTEPALQCLQACLVCRTIQEVRMKLSSTLAMNATDIAVIFAGNFNGEPDHMSIELMKNGNLTESQMKILETLTYDVNEGKARPMEFYDVCHVSKYLSKYLENPLKLSSAFYDAKGSEPVLTAANGSYVGCLDYIFYTPDLKLVSVIDIDSSIENTYVHGGPTELFASDHLPLVAEFGY